MIFVFNDEASREYLSIKGELFKYLFKVRRHKIGDEIAFRNRDDLKNIYIYKVIELETKSATLKLLSSKELEVKAKKSLHIGWCVIDSKSIEKVLASLNEIGVEKISFIYCDRSQKNFKLDFKRFDRILEASMQQCGRSSKIEFEVYKNLKDFINDYPQTVVFDFCDNILKQSDDFKTVLIGCEGGFSKGEKDFLSTLRVFRLDTPLILRSESAVLAVSSKILL